MSPPPLSVVLPVHNGMPYVEESVASILAQSFGDFEFVIGDDGSSDGTTGILRRLAAADKRIRLVRREHPSGLASAANWVVSEAQAPLIAMAHADDRAHPRRLDRQMELLLAQPDADLVGTLWEGIDEEGRSVRPPDFLRLLRRLPFAPFAHSSIMFRRNAFERAGGYRREAEYWEDLDLYYRMAARGRVCVVPDVLTCVRHARVSTRLRDAQDRVEEAVDLMYRAAEEHAKGRDHGPLLFAPPSGSDRKLHPLTFVSCGSTLMWTGRRPRVLGRMWARARLRFDAASFHALLWVLWAESSPKSLRLFLRTLLRLRNLAAAPLVRGKPYVEWRTMESAPPHPPASGPLREARRG